MQSARGFEYGVVHLISPRSGLIVDIVSSELSLETSAVKTLLDLGSIYHQHQRVKEDISVLFGDYVRVHTRPRRFPDNSFNWTERLLFQNDDFVIVNKPAGLPVHASVDNTLENLLSYLSIFLQIPLYITHRLDVPTKGLIVFAKTLSFQREFNKALIAREVRKLYRAVIKGEGPPLGIMTHYMEPSPRAPKKVSSHFTEGWQDCVLEILTKKKLSESETEIFIELHTGRTHQIRAQMAAAGFPLLGDISYGAEKYYVQEEIGLTAYSLSFAYKGEALNFKI